MRGTKGPFLGSAKSNKYHRADCVWAQKISPANLVTFKSPEEAQSRGYVPCKVCGPPLAASGNEPAQASVLSPQAAAPSQEEEIVYVTRTGSKYHRAGCRYLKSVIPDDTAEGGREEVRAVQRVQATGVEGRPMRCERVLIRSRLVTPPITLRSAGRRS